MSLNSIKFETTDIALLFKNSLVEIGGETQESTKDSKSPIVNAEWKYLGENKKKTLIVVRYDTAVHLPDKQLSFLTKLLTACNLNLADVAIFNFQNYNAAQFNDIINYFNPKAVLLFETKPDEFGMPMNFPDFQVQAYKDAVFVSSPSLETIEPNKDLKGKLWICLKKIYNL
jgi:hypothetical protein